VFDANTILRDQEIGTFEIDIAYVYNQPVHQLSQKWVALAALGIRKTKKKTKNQKISAFLFCCSPLSSLWFRRRKDKKFETSSWIHQSESGSGGSGGFAARFLVGRRERINNHYRRFAWNGSLSPFRFGETLFSGNPYLQGSPVAQDGQWPYVFSFFFSLLFLSLTLLFLFSTAGTCDPYLAVSFSGSEEVKSEVIKVSEPFCFFFSF
jgi:hypothetical protein